VSEILPDGYGLLIRGEVRAFAWTPAMGWLERSLDEDGTLEAWACGAGSVEIARGRGSVRAREAPLSGPDGSRRWVCRHYRRGGWAAPLLGDRYLAGELGRPFHELTVSDVARARGVRTPAVVAGAVYGAGVLRRADLVTEQVPCARSLATWLLDVPEPDLEQDLLRRAGHALGELERARVLHGDASAGNFLLPTAGPAWIVDLDRGTASSLERPAFIGRMRRRLERSLRKIAAIRGVELTSSSWQALRTSYEETA
jgi:3-deoxy-D-manno-octulosonic acid kinase